MVPTGFDRYARVRHPLDGGLWADRAPGYLRVGVGDLTAALPVDLDVHDGDLGDDLVDLLVPRLAAATSTPADGHFGLGRLGRGAPTSWSAHAGRRGPFAGWRRAGARRRVLGGIRSGAGIVPAFGTDPAQIGRAARALGVRDAVPAGAGVRSHRAELFGPAAR